VNNRHDICGYIKGISLKQAYFAVNVFNKLLKIQKSAKIHITYQEDTVKISESEVFARIKSMTERSICK